MIPRDILKEIRRIQIATSRLVTDVFAGQYQSAFKGSGMEFHEVREYLPGDEIRSIDWNVTARAGHPFVKKFVEERELTVMLLLDMSASSYFGSARQLKIQLAAHICSLLAFSAIKNNDRVGFIAFTDRIEKFVPPGKGVRHVLRVVREALYFKPRGKGTDVNLALEYLNRVTTRRTVAFLISDFLAPDFRKTLAASNKRHDIVAVTITDPRETELPNAGLVKLFDPETRREFVLDTSDRELRRQYNLRNSRRSADLVTLFRSAGVDTVSVRTDIPYYRTLFEFFRMRERRRR